MSRWVHPRERGGARAATDARRQLAGPSPRARGSRPDTPPAPVAVRSIPASAGEPTGATGTTVLGHPLSMPVIVAPTAFHKLAHPDGEVATVRAAGQAGTAHPQC